MAREHVFLSYNTADQAFVETLRRSLHEEGLTSWYDASVTRPGVSWVTQVEEALQHIPVLLVCLGAHGLGVYQRREVEVAIGLQLQSPERLIIPVLLPHAPKDLEVPAFLSVYTWVDLRSYPQRQLGVLYKYLRSGQAPALEALQGREDCPYRGLEAFTEWDADRFFGREKQVDALQQTLDTVRFLTVMGASGSGKSSLVFAGLLPGVRRSGLAGCSAWTVLDLRPGPRPCHELAVRLMQARGRDDTLQLKQLEQQLREAPDTLSLTVDLWLNGPEKRRLLLVVDQLEELFTHTEQEAERKAFLDALQHAATVPGGRITVVCTLRADFMNRALEHPLLSGLITPPHLFLLRSMERQGLHEAIVLPASRSGVLFEDGLVDTLVDEVHDQPGALPLLQFTLESLWQARSGAELTWRAYRGLGGLKGAITQRAESLLAGWDDAQRLTVRRLLGRLVQMGEHAEDTRRRASSEELWRMDPERAPGLLTQLIDERLLTATGDQVEVAHEALIREWKTLRDWLLVDREDLRLRQELGRGLVQWTQGGEKAEDLLHGGLLQRAVELLDRGSVPLSPEEERLVRTSQKERLRREAQKVAQQRREVEHAQRLAQRNRFLWIALGVAFLGLVGALWGRWLARERLDNSLRLAEALTSKIDQTLQPVAGSGSVRKDMLDQVILLLEPLGDHPEALRLRLFSYQQRALLQDRADKRQDDLSAALLAARELLRAHPEDLLLFEKQTNLTYQLAQQEQELGQEEATALYEDYLESARKLVAQRQGGLEQAQQMNLAALYLSQSATTQGHPFRARELLYQSLDVVQTAVRGQPPAPLSEFLIAQSYMELGRAQERIGRLEDAETFYNWALWRLKPDSAMSMTFGGGLNPDNLSAGVLKPALHELLGHVMLLQDRPLRAYAHFQDMGLTANAVLRDVSLKARLPELYRRHVGVVGSLAFEPEDDDEEKLQAFYDILFQVKAPGPPGEEDFQTRMFLSILRAPLPFAHAGKHDAVIELGFKLVSAYSSLGELVTMGGRPEEGKLFTAKAIACFDLFSAHVQAAGWPADEQLFLTHKLSALAEKNKEDPRLSRVLDRTIDHFNGLLEHHPKDTELLKHYSLLLTVSGQRYEEEGQMETAWQHYQAALEMGLRVRQAGDQSEENDQRIILAHLRLAWLTGHWKPKRAQELYLQTLAECEKALSKHPKSVELLRELGFLHERLAGYAWEAQHEKEGWQLIQKSIHDYEQAVEQERDDTESRSRLARVYLQANAFLSLERSETPKESSDAYLHEALDLLLGLIRDEPLVEDHPFQLSHVYDLLGVRMQQKGEYALAQKYFEENLKLSKGFAANHPDNPKLQWGLAVCYRDLGELAQQQQHLEEARALLGKSMELMRALIQSAPRNAEFQKDLEKAQATWCHLLESLRDPAALAECAS